MNLTEATVLIVDDEQDLREIFTALLAFSGCTRIYTAEDGKEALAVLNQVSIDLLVTDVRMPVMDGITLVRRLWALGKPVPSIVFVSGFGDIDEREMYGLGVEAFLAKPVPQAQLLEVMENSLADRSARWLTPMLSAPRQSMRIPLRETDETAEDSISLGRGGFSARYPGLLAKGRVTFSCHFSSERGEMAGEGYVRWRSRTDDKVGIEFAFLDAHCRPWLLEEIAKRNPQEFIPSSL